MRRQGIRRLIVALALLASAPPIASGQDPEPLHLDGLFPTGGRATVTEAWGTLQFSIDNRGDTPREARVVTFYIARPDIQYARDVRVPPHSRITSWLSVGPAPDHPAKTGRELAYQLFDRTGGANREVRRGDAEQLLSRALPYRPRETTTAVYTDAAPTESDDIDPLDDRESRDSESVRLAQTFRDSRGLSELVSIVRDRHLPPTPETLAGVDQFVLAGNRLAADPPGRQALRQWVVQGGTLWVLLDRVDPDVVAPILGEGLRFQVVGRTTLTSLRLRAARAERANAEKRDFDQPVELVQVLLSGSETLLADANDWPAAFSQSVGRGRVVFTTLGARGWYRPRTPRDPRSRFEHVPDLPVPIGTFEWLTGHIYPEPEREPVGEAFRVEDLAPMLAAEIGYEVIGRRTAGVILGAFLLFLVVLAIGLRRSRWPEVIGLGAPAVAVAAAAAFVIAGAGSRRAVPPTAGTVAVISVSPDGREDDWRGLFALYNPSSGPVDLGSRHGGRVDFDLSGLEGSTRRRVETDIDAWHWENLSFPAGVRMGPFQSTGRTGVSVLGRFGPNGFEGRLDAGAFRNAGDAVLRTRAGTVFAARLEADGSFRIDSGDVLPAGQYLPGAVLTDRQQRRQDLYRKLFSTPRPAAARDHDELFVWAETDELPFAAGGAERTVGMALLAVPIQYRHAVGGSALVPGGFVPFATTTDGRARAPRLEHTEPVRSRLRFQLPDWGRPFAVERATLLARVSAPGRKFSVMGVVDDRPVPLHEQASPAGSVRVEITDPRLLRTDAGGGLYLELVVGEQLGPDGKERPAGTREQGLKWQIEALGLEVVGRPTGE